VLRISAGGHSILLTGDIERGGEAELIEAADVRSDAIVVPHHGSRTSSTPQLVAAVAPRWAIVPVGYRSRFGHPHPQVLERYRDAGAEILRTDLDGAVELRMGSGVAVSVERRTRGRYWLQ
jgi:competence protein ComEC